MCNILLFCLILGLPWNTLANTNASFPDREAAHLQPLESTSSQAQPDDNANRFRIPHQGESRINILSRLANPDSLTEVEDPSFGKLYGNSSATAYASFNYRVARNLERSLTIKKLIYPFHSFL